MGVFQLDHSINLSYALESKGSCTEWDTYFNCYANTSKRLLDYKVASLKDSLQKTNTN